MELKITLTTKDVVYDVRPDTMKNWADVVCSFTRSDYGGVVRKFTSQFDFAGETRKFLIGLYLADGVGAQCTIAIFSMNDRWEHVKEFECPLDFSTMHWDDYVLSVSAVDNSLAAMIKANKGVKYEMLVGEDIAPDSTFHFDRLPMMESATYAFTQGNSDDETGALSVEMTRGELPWLGNIASEIAVNQVIHYNDDQESDSNGCMATAIKPASVKFGWNVDIDTYSHSGAGIRLGVMVKNGATIKRTQLLSDPINGSLVLGGTTRYTYLGEYQDSSSLPTATSAMDNNWALIDGTVWIVVYAGSYSCRWSNTGKTPKEQFRATYQGSVDLDLEAGDKVIVYADWNVQTLNTSRFTINSSRFTLSWIARGAMCDIPAFTPETVGNAILKKLAGDGINALVDISGFDPRIAKTMVLAAECVRDMPQPKLYSSFTDYAGWMEAVFGYVYWVGERGPNRFKRVVKAGAVLWTPYTTVTAKYEGEIDPENVVYIEQYNKFYYHSPEDGRYYITFDGREAYMRSDNRPLSDVVYDFTDGGLVYFDYDEDGTPNPRPQVFRLDPLLVGKDVVTVHFAHRSELFHDSEPRDISNAVDTAYSINGDRLFATVKVGYSEKDYGKANGRDEFNFNVTYATGTTASEKELSLISKYRADTYGLEFAAQKRGADTTDTDSDKDVFFVCCDIRKKDAYPDRSETIDGTISDQVFNAAFSPRACALANAGYIGMQTNGLTLKYASSKGNSEVSIDGIRLDEDIHIEDQLFTCGIVEFSTDCQDDPSDFGDVVRIVSNGVEYTGYISDLERSCFRTEAAKYKLIAKTVTPL